MPSPLAEAFLMGILNGCYETPSYISPPGFSHFLHPVGMHARASAPIHPPSANKFHKQLTLNNSPRLLHGAALHLAGQQYSPNSSRFPPTERRRRDVCTTHCVSCGTTSPPTLCGGASESATPHTAQAWAFLKLFPNWEIYPRPDCTHSVIITCLDSARFQYSHLK